MGSQNDIAMESFYSKKASQLESSMVELSVGSSPSLANVDSSCKNTAQFAAQQLYQDGMVNLIPMPTCDPKDPLNLPNWRKLTVIFSLCLFGSMAAAAELILGAMLPVFSFEYAGIDPKILAHVHLPSGVNGLTALAAFPGPPIWKIYLLGSLPILMIGVANFFLVPLSIAVGRRTVILATGIIALAGCLSSGFTHSLEAHLLCRVIQALGAGTVESLIPFIIQDIVFYHQRNAAVSAVFATQGLIVVALGISAPYIVGYASWRVIYFITAGAGLLFWIIMFFVLPETKFDRSDDETKGIPTIPLRPGQARPDIDYQNYPARNWKEDLRVCQTTVDWREGITALWDSLRTFFYPHLLFITMLNSAVIAATLASGYTAAPQLISEPWSWPFFHLGFCLLPVIIAAVASFFVSGWGADRLANWLAKKRGNREPEIQALNLVFPCSVGVVGCLLFGFAGENPQNFHWMVFLIGLGMIAFSFLATNTIGIVYVLESHPNLAGPSLVNIASFRCLIAFALSFRVSEWVAELGYLKTFLIYAGILSVFILFVPVVYVWGAGWRKHLDAQPKSRGGFVR
ncbi:hypothetical protein E4U57_007532 [Claviceps arundinis]|uniref:Major facilitator superfamily (MFS) profile domain-containing protein n=1 Tax=Claviceps arundinis TaxID=1623583 RepID=A0ABQ7PEW9_9HYPO|nr:hypothetical protein E4U57_007532 [Claviceps arundinis]